ncbi:unnamed protein product [Tetraodon nigroviridis]|uniref:(spotted green pufferfish) hypothetical protein n=1 Tax=Tetraodon nigroviridis TaxID=99883 RepID=Q4SMW8_TETNG|nr:unnamed protein product [Tetraodon nigroviridis]
MVSPRKRLLSSPGSADQLTNGISRLPGWITPPEPVSLSADTGAGWPPVARYPAGYRGVTPALWKRAPPRGDSKERSDY